MKTNFMKRTCLLSALMLVSMFVSTASAQWEKVKTLDAAYAGFITKSGNMLLSDYQFDGSGGIYLSTDKGTTWNHLEAEDNSYNRFCADGDYIYAVGLHARIARSADEGKTWDIVSYAEKAAELMDPDAVEYTACYAIAPYHGRLFIGDFCGAGVLYTEDNGETWKATNFDAMRYQVEDEYGVYDLVDNLYQLVVFKDKLYAFGMYKVYEYDEAEDSWIVKRNDSNFMAESAEFNGSLYCGRSCPNDDPDAAFLEKTEDFENWTIIPAPKGTLTKNVRTMASDENYVYVVTQDRGAFVYDVNEETWYEINEGFPEKVYPGEADPNNKFYHAPTKLYTDDNYLYVVIYDVPYAEGEFSGLYRLAKSDIHQTTAIENVVTNENFSVNNGYLYIPGASAIKLFEVSGKQVMESNTDRVCTGNLGKGVYLFEAECAGRTNKGKFAL